jgi:hypothetical protein
MLSKISLASGLTLGCSIQPRQHEADHNDGVFRFTETHPSDQPRVLPTRLRLWMLVRLSALCCTIFEIWPSGASLLYQSDF